LKSPAKRNNKLLELAGKHYHHMLPHEMEEIVWNMMRQVKDANNTDE